MENLTITDGFDRFSNNWGVVDRTPGQLTVSSLASQDYQDAGSMFQGNGLGYGTFSFDVATRYDNVPGPYVLLWPDRPEQPGDDQWPGFELDVLETHGNGSGDYSTRHYDDNPSGDHVEYRDDRASIYNMPEHDTTILTTYTLEWSPGNLWYLMNGVPYAHESEHVPMDADHGGVNMLPSMGIHYWPEIIEAQQGRDNAITMTEFRYDPWF